MERTTLTTTTVHPSDCRQSVSCRSAISRTSAHLIETTSHPLATAYLHILDPRKPFPPATRIFFFAVAEAVAPAAEAIDRAGGSLVELETRI
ncbi:hypothetical protein ES702_03179 [subsurface metagenome]